jgi:hypothetical protein
MRYRNSIGISFVVLIASCKVYTPQPAPVPLMSAKHELQLNGGITIPPGISGSVAYSPFNHVAIQVHGSMGPLGSDYFQGMLGYYRKNTQNLNMECYGGIAHGYGKAMKASNSPTLEGNYSIYFSQLNFGQNRMGNNRMDYGIGLKVGLFNIKVTDNGYFENNDLDQVNYNSQYYFLEPMAFIRLGKGRLRTCVQINGASLISAATKQRLIPYHSIALGVYLNYQVLKDKTVKK